MITKYKKEIKILTWVTLALVIFILTPFSPEGEFSLIARTTITITTLLNALLYREYQHYIWMTALTAIGVIYNPIYIFEIPSPQWTMIHVVTLVMLYFNMSVLNRTGNITQTLIKRAESVFFASGNLSTSYLQRELRIGYADCARLVDMIREKHIEPLRGSTGHERIKLLEQDELTIDFVQEKLGCSRDRAVCLLVLVEG